MFLTFLMKLYIQLQLLFHRKDGATAIEYAILVAVIALVVLVAARTLGTDISNLLERVSTAIAPAA
ncbi:Flp family type IVb pilin [Pseudomonas sp. ADAK18]|uniref:Flp family type IVb pilin n=1 Tax=Pseudomonas sp. ADAK18 TaxID=2730848 RepID=UPI001464023B|nr:Flp family type IVb pilin [Pseudomonas sp. ADAK18]QJI32574.1 Flp family type IVb pilin [Pseudomonas sp. ADAK18]